MQAALVIILLLAILAGAVFVGHYGWVSAGDVVMPAWGWLMLGLGVFFTLLVGGGLMALVFYSSREGFDEPPELAQKKKRRAAKWAKLVPLSRKRSTRGGNIQPTAAADPLGRTIVILIEGELTKASTVTIESHRVEANGSRSAGPP